MSAIEGATVLITGGASGIGLLTGQRLLAAGAARLVIWDIDGPALDTVLGEAERVQRQGVLAGVA